jgi:hypothetical protein
MLLAASLGAARTADDTTTIRLGATRGAWVRSKPTRGLDKALGEQPCPAAWCVEYEISRYGTFEELDRPLQLKLQFNVGGLCKKEPNQKSTIMEPTVRGIRDTGGFKISDADGCTVGLIKVSLLSAKLDGQIIGQEEVGEVDFTDRLTAIQSVRDAEATRQRRLAAERKTKQAEDDARHAKVKAEQDARAAEERRQIRVACGALYQKTADKKIGDPTVREEQQVRACQALGLYPPQ